MQADGRDLVLGLPNRIGMGYGLSNRFNPIGPRACYWGGYGGSLVTMDQDTGLTVSYVMNRMENGLTEDVRAANIGRAAAAALERGLTGGPMTVRDRRGGSPAG